MPTKLPKKIQSCPIVEAILEVRLDSDLPGEAIFGLIYNEFKEDFPNLEKLPILQLPDVIRTQDPNLIFSPHYKLTQDPFIIQIGPKVFSIAVVGEYPGWDVFYPKIEECIERVTKLKIYNALTRIGLRYINIFDKTNIFDHSTLSLSVGSNPLGDSKTNLTTEIDDGDCTHTLRISNDIKANLKGDKPVEGSVLDIDTSIKDVTQDIYKSIAITHLSEKKLFYSLLQPQLIESLNPDY